MASDHASVMTIDGCTTGGDVMMKSLAVLLLFAGGAPSGLIVDNPVDPTLGSLQVTGYNWAAQKFSVTEPTRLTRVEAFAQRFSGFDDPKIAVYTDDAGEPGDAGFTAPDERIFEQSFSFPEDPVTPFDWISTGQINGPALQSGTYWLAVVSNPDVDFVGRIGVFNDPMFENGRPVADHRRVELFDDDGRVIGHELVWNTIETISHLSVRIHGDRVPEPGAAPLLHSGILVSVMGFRWLAKGRRC